MADRITDEQRTKAEAAIARLTPKERNLILRETLATVTAHGDDPDRMVQLGRDIKGTVRLRGIPGYREMVDTSRQPAA